MLTKQCLTIIWNVSSLCRILKQMLFLVLFYPSRYCTYCTPEDAKMPYLCIDQLMQFLILTFTPSDAMLYPY